MENVVKRGRPRGLFAAKKVGEEVETEAPKVERQEMRPPMRAEDPKARAAQRAAELRGHLGELDEGTDRYYVPADWIPDGWTYNWKRFSFYNEPDNDNQIRVKREGWTPVPISRHPQMMPDGYTGDIIMRDGLVLMECPTEIVVERQAIELRRAREQVRFKEQQLSGTPEGTMTRDHAKVRPQIKKSFEAMPIPEE